MKIIVDSFLRQPDIISLLESQQSPVYRHEGHVKNFKGQMIFDVSEVAEGVNVVAYTKGLIKSQPYGKAIVFRVIEEGKNW